MSDSGFCEKWCTRETVSREESNGYVFEVLRCIRCGAVVHAWFIPYVDAKGNETGLRPLREART